MKTKLQYVFSALACLAFSALNSPLSTAQAQGTAFTYQGSLNNGANAANGSYDLEFSLFNAGSGGLQVGHTVTELAVGVTNGLFTTTIDFGAGVFTGASLWLDISARTAGSGAFSELGPRQAITPTPYAITAENLSGVVPLAQLPPTVALLNDPGTGNFFAGFQAGNSSLTGTDNTAVGDGALSANTGGSYNTAQGNAALEENQGGSGNVAFGALALFNNVSGYDNSAFGTYALYGNKAANYNTASGAFALSAYQPGTAGPITGSGNTADGAYALYSDQAGSNNTAAGFQALYNNLSGNKNTADGYNALFSNTSGVDNTANGYAALFNNISGNWNTAVGYGALYANTNGNKNTANGFDALNDNTSGVDNTANGYEALYSNTTGDYNTAVGDSALYANTAGEENTAIGFEALTDNTAGSNNVANGYQALHNNTTSDGNVAVGYQALQNGLNVNNGVANGFSVAVGYQALQHSTADSGAVAVGASALQTDTAINNNNLDGGHCDNTAIGYIALTKNSGLENTAVGAWTLGSYSENTGNGNTAVGSWALSGYYGNLTGSNNVALGYLAGSTITSGNNNIDIGNEGVAGDNNAIRIGNPGTQSTTIIAGIWEGSLPGTQGTPVYVDAGGHLGTVKSSARFKEDIKSMADASEALYALRPVTFRYRPAIDPTGAPQFGLVAEEVDQVEPDLVVRDNKNQVYTVRYEAVNAMLLNEFLKEHRTVETQETEIQGLKQQHNSLAERLNELQAAVKALAERK